MEDIIKPNPQRCRSCAHCRLTQKLSILRKTATDTSAGDDTSATQRLMWQVNVMRCGSPYLISFSCWLARPVTSSSGCRQRVATTASRRHHAFITNLSTDWRRQDVERRAAGRPTNRPGVVLAACERDNRVADDRRIHQSYLFSFSRYHPNAQHFVVFLRPRSGTFR